MKKYSRIAQIFGEHEEGGKLTNERIKIHDTAYDLFLAMWLERPLY